MSTGYMSTTRDILQRVLHLPEGYEIESIGLDVKGEAIWFHIKGDDIPPVQEGELLPILTCTVESVQDEKGKQWVRVERIEQSQKEEIRK